MARAWRNNNSGEVIIIEAREGATWHDLPYFFLEQVGFGCLAEWEEIPAENA